MGNPWLIRVGYFVWSLSDLDTKSGTNCVYEGM